MLSIMLHALGIGTAMVLAAELSILPREKSFQWEVSLIAASHPELLSSDLPTPVPAASALRQVTPDIGSPQPNSPETASHKTITASAPIGAAPSDMPSHELPSTHMAERVSLRKSEANHKAQLPPDVASPEPLTPHEEPSVAIPELTAVFPMAEPISGGIPPPEIDASDRSILASEPSVQHPPRVLNRPLPQYREPVVSQTLQPDFGWLAGALFTKVEQLKRYPHTAKTHRWEGNVVVQAIVMEDGRVENVTVVKSSGHPTLDQEAVALLERTSPISLKHPLGQPHIVVQLPIGYHLE
jgi:protein TonB